MKILVVVGKQYYGHAEAIEPMYYEFTEPLRELGHHVDHFDHMRLYHGPGREACGEQFLQAVRGGYDLILYQTAGHDWMPREAIREAGRFAPTIAWNSDDDWQWESYTRELYASFTFMATTYPHIHEKYRASHPRLLLTQWACFERFADASTPKDLDFSFVGQIYGSRLADCLFLRRKAGLKVYGKGSEQLSPGHRLGERVRRAVRPNAPSRPSPTAVDFIQTNRIWNRTKISFTPMEASADPRLWQIKSRAFEMGLSGTVMLCQPSPNLERYYEPGHEFVPFSGIEECAEKARYYLSHDTERQKIADAYRARTRAEHLWSHRFRALFRDAGLEAA